MTIPYQAPPGAASHTKHAISPKKADLHVQLAQKLGIDILSRKLSPGDILPSETELAEIHALSRTSVRDALRILTAKGIVEPRRKRGTCVTERVKWNMLDPDVLSWMFSTKPDERLVRNLFEIRLILEPAAARFAAQRRTQSHLNTMAEALHIMKNETLFTKAGLDADIQFHAALMAASDNEQLMGLNASIGATVALSTHYKIEHNILDRDPIPSHLAVYRAIEQGNPEEAHWCMQYLVRLAVKDLLQDEDRKHLPDAMPERPA